ncbi:MAG: BatA domain-containing protein [Aquirufa sp.]
MNSFFGNPGILWALLGVAVPIWLHFYQKKNKQSAYFSDLRWLALNTDLSKGSKDWKNILLLILRILALICLILAFAKPQWAFLPKTIKKEGSYIFYLDNHPSLILGNRKGFLATKNQLQPSPSKNIRFFSNEFLARDFEWSSSNEIKSNWSKIEPSIQNPLAKSVINQFENLSDGENQEPTYVWISDFPKSKEIPAFKKNQQVKLLPISKASGENVIVDSVWVEDGFIQVKEKFKVKLRLKNSTLTRSSKRRTIGFYLNDFLLSNQVISFNPSGFCDLDFELSLPSNGDFPAHFILDDEVIFDNKYHFVLSTSKAQKVYFVQNGQFDLPLRRVFEPDSLFDFEPITKEKWIAQGNTSHGFAIIRGVENFTDTEWQMLLQRLSNGQSMILIPSAGQNNQAIRFLNLFWGQKKISLNSEEGLSVIHPSFNQAFFRKIIPLNSMAENLKTWDSRISLILPKSKSSILSTTKGNSYLENIPIGKGHLFLFAADVLDAGIAFQKHSLFLPIFQEIVLQNSYSEPLNLIYQKKVFSIFPKKDFQFVNKEKQLLKFKNSTMEFVPEQEWMGDHWNCRLPSSVETGVALNGFYAVFAGNEKLGIWAINYPKSESETVTYSHEDLKSHYAKYPNVEVLDPTDTFKIASGDFQIENASKYFLCLSLILFLLEMAVLGFYKINALPRKLPNQP